MNTIEQEARGTALEMLKRINSEMQRAAKDMENNEDRVFAVCGLAGRAAALLEAMLANAPEPCESCTAEADAPESALPAEASAAHADIKAGDVITIDGVEDCPPLVVLEKYENGDLFCITQGMVGECEFGESSNYADENCTLRHKCEKWLADVAKRGLDLAHVKEREISLLSVGGVDYGKLKVHAAPLTFDEWRTHARLCMADTEDGFWYWTATSAAEHRLRSPYANSTDNVWHVYTGGYTDYDYAYGSYGVRPALILDSLLSCSKKN